MRRRCEDCDDRWDDQPYIAFQSNYTRRDDGDSESVERECAGGEFGSIYGYGYGKFEYERDVERERDGRRVGRAGDDFGERKLYGAGDAAKSGCFDCYGDQRCDDVGERVERGHDFESDADAGGDESGEHRDGEFYDHAYGDEFYFGRAGDAQRHGADDYVCLVDATDGERE